jgi:hypothetical protein
MLDRLNSNRDHVLENDVIEFPRFANFDGFRVDTTIEIDFAPRRRFPIACQQRTTSALPRWIPKAIERRKQFRRI